jgi:signal transduction histidine kinase
MDVAHFNRVMDGEIDGYSLDKRWIRKGGNVIYATISVKCLRRADSSVDYFVALLQDITERKRAEEALAQAAEAAKKGQELKSTFLDALAHEIKTPLTATKMAVTTLLADGGQMTAEHRRELLGVIDRTTDRLNAWSSETIRAASIEAGTKSLTKERRNSSETIHSMVEELSLEFENISLDVQLDATSEVEVDVEMITAVLRILVENAHKYSPAGSPAVISCRPEGENIIVSVRDFGPGIPADEQERIFEQYYRGRSSSETQGMGLGLAIARNIVHAHGGDLWVTSEPGRGATFQFSLSSSRGGTS